MTRHGNTTTDSLTYLAEARITLGTNETLIDISLTVSNLKKTPMDLLYLGHANFRPVDDGELIYSARYDRDHVRVRKSIPPHIHPPEGYREFIEELSVVVGVDSDCCCILIVESPADVIVAAKVVDPGSVLRQAVAMPQ